MMGEGVMVAQFKSNLKQLILNESAKRGTPLTQRELSQKSGVSSATITRWYKGGFDRIDADTVMKLTRFFGCSINELIEVED